MGKLFRFITALGIISLLIAPFNLVASADTPSYPELASGVGSTLSGNVQAIGLSKDGRYILLSTTNGYYLRDRQMTTTTIIPINGMTSYDITHYMGLQLSGDGSSLLFTSQRKYVNSTSSSPTTSDLFLENLSTGSIIDISSAITTQVNGYNANYGVAYYMSDNGNTIAFSLNYSYTCGNSICVNGSVYYYNVSTGAIQVTAASLNQIYQGVFQNTPLTYSVLGMSGDGDNIFYKSTLAGSNPSSYIWKYNITSAQTTQILPGSYVNNKLSISTDGRYIGFLTNVSNIESQTPIGCNKAMITNGSCLLYYRDDTSNGTMQRVTALADGSLPDGYNPNTDSSSIMSGDGNTAIWATQSIMRSSNTYHRYYEVYSKNISMGTVHLISINNQEVPAGAGVLQALLFLTNDGSEAVINLAAPNFGGPLLCTASSDVGPNHPVPCMAAYVVSTSPTDIVDNLAPSINSALLSQSTVPPGSSPKLSIQATDSGSGVALGEYYVGNTDPGLGNATPLQYDAVNNILYAYIDPGTIQAAGAYNIHYRLYDNVGNWTLTYATQLTVTSIFAPTGLTATSPTKNPVLSWSSVSGAVSYKVYRDGTQIATLSSTSYTDNTASETTHAYYVTASNDTIESDASNTISILVDRTRPIMNFSTPSTFGTFTTGPTVTVTASDDASGLQIIAIHVYTSSNQLLTTCGTGTPTQIASGSMSCSLASLANGMYYIKAGSFDNAGNNQTINSGNFTIQH